MCDAFLQNYASFIDEVNNEPNVVLFSGTHCTGVFQPRRDVALQNVGDIVSLPFRVLGPRSLFVPFNFGRVRFFRSNDTRFVDFQGPTLIADLTGAFWPGTLDPMIDIAGFQVLEQRSWDDVIVPDMCMGRVFTLGATALRRFRPGHEKCDAFMEKTFCVDERLDLDTRCSCYKDLIGVKEESTLIGIALPVTCFGRSCATTRSYKSATMLQKPCQLTVCRQILREEGLIAGTRSRVVTCAGKFFEHQRDVPAETVGGRVDPASNEDLSGATPASSWLVFGVTAVLLLVFVFLMFYRVSTKVVPKGENFVGV